MRCLKVFLIVSCAWIGGVADAAARSAEQALDQIRLFNPVPDSRDTAKTAAWRSKLCKIATSPWVFYRGTNHLFWWDMARDPKRTSEYGSKKTLIWLQGDLHAENYGSYDDAEGDLVYGLNDFDESLIADYQYDLWRMATSLVLLAEENKRWIDEELAKPVSERNRKLSEQEKLGPDERKAVVEKFVKAYLNKLDSFVGNDDETTFAIGLTSPQEPEKPLKKFLEKTRADNSRQAMLEKETTRPEKPEEQPKFDMTRVDKYLELKQDAPRWGELEAALVGYRKTLADRQLGADESFFTVKDIARRFGGTGGLSAERYYLLIEGEDAGPDDDRILDVKQQTAPTPLSFLGDAENRLYRCIAGGNHARRHALAYRAMVPKPDPLLGWMVLPDGTRFSVRQRSPFKDGLRVIPEQKAGDIKRSKLKDLDDYLAMAKQWGELLAAAHARSDKDYDKDLIDYSFEKQVLEKVGNDRDGFVASIVKIAVDYAKVVKGDFEFYGAHPLVADCQTD